MNIYEKRARNRLFLTKTFQVPSKIKSYMTVTTVISSEFLLESQSPSKQVHCLNQTSFPYYKSHFNGSKFGLIVAKNHFYCEKQTKLLVPKKKRERSSTLLLGQLLVLST